MPTNLPPEYSKAEKLYRAAESTAEKIIALEELISTIPKHKGTDKLRANFRRRLSKLKASVQTGKRAGVQRPAFHIDKEGAGQVVVIGPANVGKSALIVALTNASPEVSESPYTTWKPTPGMMPVEDIQIQMIDTPPLNKDYVEPQLFDLIRRADLILLVLDLQTYPVQHLEDTIGILKEHRIVPSHQKDLYAQERRTSFIPVLVLANKCDDESCDEVFEVFCELLEDEWRLLPISVSTGKNLEVLKRDVFELLNIIRVYSKAPGKEPDLDKPFVLKRGSTVEELAEKVHQDFFKQLKTARLWGSSVFEGQMVQRDYVLQDGDVVELRI